MFQRIFITISINPLALRGAQRKWNFFDLLFLQGKCVRRSNILYYCNDSLKNTYFNDGSVMMQLVFYMEIYILSPSLCNLKKVLRMECASYKPKIQQYWFNKEKTKLPQNVIKGYNLHSASLYWVCTNPIGLIKFKGSFVSTILRLFSRDYHISGGWTISSDISHLIRIPKNLLKYIPKQIFVGESLQKAQDDYHINGGVCGELIITFRKRYEIM